MTASRTTTIEISKEYLHFNSGHFTIFSRDQREDLHGHTFRVRAFIAEHQAATGKQIDAISDSTMAVLMDYGWPGNVRELRNAIEYAYVKCHTGSIDPEHLPPEIREHEDKPTTTPGPTSKLTREQIVVALAKAGGNKKLAAKLLGVGRATLYRNLSKYELS